MLKDISEGVRMFLDVTAITVAIGVIAKIIPVIAGTMSIIWLGMQMYDWIQNKRKK